MEDGEKVKFLSESNTLVVPEVHMVDGAGAMVGMKSVKLV